MYLSIRDDVVFAAGYGTIAEGLKDLNIPGIELFVKRDDTVTAIVAVPGRERLNLTLPEDMATLKEQAVDSGIVIAALCMGNNFNAPDKDFEVDWAVRTVHAARELDAPAVRIDAIMSGERDLPLEDRIRLVATSVKRILAETEDTGVDLGIENHGFQGNDPAFVKATLDAVGDARLGLTLDSGNYYWRGWPLSRVYEIFDEFAPYVKHTHIKNINYPKEIRETMREMGYGYDRYVSPIHKGDIDHTRYFAALRRVGYERDLCLEDESLGKFDIPARKANLRGAAEFFVQQLHGV